MVLGWKTSSKMQDPVKEMYSTPKRYGHTKQNCPHQTKAATPPPEEQPAQSQPSEKEGGAIPQVLPPPKPKAGLLGEWMDESTRRRTRAWKARKKAEKRSVAVAEGERYSLAGSRSGRVDHSKEGAKDNRFAFLQQIVEELMEKDRGEETVEADGEESDQAAKGKFVFRGDKKDIRQKQNKTNAAGGSLNARIQKPKKASKDQREGPAVVGLQYVATKPKTSYVGPAQEAEYNPNAERNKRRRLRRKIKKYGKEALCVSEDSGRESNGPPKKPKFLKYLAHSSPPHPGPDGEALLVKPNSVIHLGGPIILEESSSVLKAIPHEQIVGKFWADAHQNSDTKNNHGDPTVDVAMELENKEEAGTLSPAQEV